MATKLSVKHRKRKAQASSFSYPVNKASKKRSRKANLKKAYRMHS